MTGRFEKFLLACFLFAGCHTAQLDQMPSALAREITLASKSGPVHFSIEIADTSHERARGLSRRETLPEDHGMLFIFEISGRHIFWMKDTPISLDLIFFDDDMRVVGIIENAQPFSLDSLQIDSDARYVLEVLAGTVKKHGINIHSVARLSYS